MWSKTLTNIHDSTNTFKTLQSDHRPLIAHVQPKLRARKQTTANKPRPNYKLLHQNADLQECFAISVKNRFIALANTDVVEANNYHQFEKSCDEVATTLLPRSKPKSRLRNLSSTT